MKYNKEIDKTLKALVDCFHRLKQAYDDIEALNVADDLDGLEHATSIQSAMVDRVEYLRARLQTEAVGFYKEQKKKIPKEIAELSKKISDHKADIDRTVTPQLRDIFNSLFDLGAEPIGPSSLSLPASAIGPFSEAVKSRSNSTTRQLEKEIIGLQSNAESFMGIFRQAFRDARLAALHEFEFDISTHFHDIKG